MLTEAVARQTSVLGNGFGPHFVEQLQVLSREPAAVWHPTIGYHLIKSRGDAEIFRGLDAGETARARQAHLSVPSRCSPQFALAIGPIRNFLKIDPLEPQNDA